MSRLKIEFKTSDGTAGYDKSVICRDVNLNHEEIEAESEKFLARLERMAKKNR